MFITIFTRDHHWSLSWATWFQTTPHTIFLMINLNIILPCKSKSCKFLTKILSASPSLSVHKAQMLQRQSKGWNDIRYNAVLVAESQLMFRRNMLHASSGSKNKPRKKPAWKEARRATLLTHSSKTFVNFQQTTYARSRTLHNHYSKNLKSYKGRSDLKPMLV
jgi:hypothetical protein